MSIETDDTEGYTMADTPLQVLGVKTIITFPRIRELRGKYSITNQVLAIAIGAKSHQTIIKRFRDGDFTISEMRMLVLFFNSKGESETEHSLFFEWLDKKETYLEVE